MPYSHRRHCSVETNPAAFASARETIEFVRSVPCFAVPASPAIGPLDVSVHRHWVTWRYCLFEIVVGAWRVVLDGFSADLHVERFVSWSVDSVAAFVWELMSRERDVVSWSEVVW